jgi:hypothetical protein
MREYVGAYFAVECELLASLFTYAQQTGVPMRIASPEGAASYLDEIAALDPHEYMANARPPATLFGLRSRPIPFFSVAKHTPHGITTISGASYGMYTDSKHNLLFAYCEPGKPPTGVDLMIPAAEIDMLVHALFVQTARHCGRTTVSDLRAVVEFRHSPEYEQARNWFAE